MPSHPPESLEGRRLGRYELLGPIGRGGMATVYLARMHGAAGFSRVVAVKLLSSSLAQAPDAVPMFLEEARLAARIRHPNVLEVYDVDVVEGELLLAMRWVEGGSLAALVRAFAADEPIGVALAVRVVHDALRGLHAAHELRTDDGRPAGLVHRDVSPPNLLVDVEGTTFLADFGVVKAADRSLAAKTQENVIKGKLGYMAPEQLRGDPNLDRRADVFATGVVLWELLTHSRLFESRGVRDLARDVLHMPIAPPGSRRSDVPTALDEIVLRALERDPARRFATAADFADALEELYGERMITTRELGRVVAKRLSGLVERQRALQRPGPSAAPQAPAPAPSGGRARRPWAAIVGFAAASAVAVAAVAAIAGARGERAPSSAAPAPSAPAPLATEAAPPPAPVSAPDPIPAKATDPAPEVSTQARHAPGRRPPRPAAPARSAPSAPFVPTEP